MGIGIKDCPVMVGIERKTLRDLIGSLESGRLAGHQLPGLIASYNVVYLIVEGISRNYGGNLEERVGKAWKGLNISGKGFDGYLNTLSTIAGITVLRTPYLEATAELIYHLYLWWAKGWEKHKSHLGFCHIRPPYALLRPPSLLRSVAKELPGVGWERSAAVEKKFKSILEMAEATEEDWRDIPGIGKILARQIVKALRGNDNV